MKKSFFNPAGLLMLVAGTLAIGFTGCKKDKPVPPSLPSLEVRYNSDVINSGHTLQAPEEATSFTISVNSNREWEITKASADTWVTVSPSSGAADKTASVTISAAENTGESRSATLTIATKGSSPKSQTLIVAQEGTMPVGGTIYFEDLGDFKDGTAIRAASGISSGWPTVEQFGSATPNNAWRRGGGVSQADVTYNGTGSIRNSAANWDSDPNNSSSSTAPYVYQSGTNAQTFIIDGINLGGKTNLTFEWIMQDTESSSEAPGGGYVPTTKPITPATINFKAGFDGQSYAVVGYTVGTVIGNGWTNVKAEFKVPSGTDKLYIRFDGFFGGQGLRMDSFTLTEGGDGALINPEPPALEFGVSTETVAVPAAGGDAIVSVTGNVAWTATITDGAGNVTSGPTPASGDGAGDITLVFPENTDTENEKVVTLTVTTTADVATKTFAVIFTQAKASGGGEKVDFTAIWNMNGFSTATWAAPMTYTFLTAGSTAVIGQLTPTNFGTSGTAAGYAWGGTGFNGNNVSDPSAYATFTINAPAGSVLNLTSIDANIRRSAQGPQKTNVEYKIGAANYVLATEWTHATVTNANGTDVAADLSGIAALQNVAGGTVVTLRFIPHTATGDGTWYFNGSNSAGHSGDALTVKGSIQ